jgi:hypothetical protein
MNRCFALAACALILGLTGCKKEEPSPESTTNAAKPAAEPATAPASTTTQVANDESATLDQIPVEEDFEDEAVESISEDNVDKKLDELEKEIASKK